LLFLMCACHAGPPATAQAARQLLLPLPASMTRLDGGFHFQAGTPLQSAFPELATLAREATEQPLPDGRGGLVLERDDSLPPEGYRLTAGDDGVRIAAADRAGAFYGLQTLRELVVDGWVAGVAIEDQPRYRWRGLMIDVARHFFPPAEIERYIELASRYKLNRLHLHLTDDQGWRIEVKSWPKLASVGGQTAVGGAAGGWYTQDEYAHLVAFAAARSVIVIPEIDVPGHCNAALSAYGELTCDGMPHPPYTGVDVGMSALCDNAATWQMLDDVAGEIAALQPGGWLHVGGDEAYQTTEADYIAFMQRLHGLVTAHGLQMIGWEELTKAGVDATVQLWLGNQQPAGDVIVSTAAHLYLDMKYDSQTSWGTSWVGYVDLDAAYDWDPAGSPGQVVGVEAALWTERVEGREQADYMIFPRLLGHAEIGWTPKELRDWNDYRRRLGQQRLDGIGFYRSPLVDWMR
jgi:hexosaminidase